MEIKNTLVKSLDSYKTTLESKAGAVSSKSGNAPAQIQTALGDRVSLSSSARLHTLAHAEAGKAPEIRQERVDAIKAHIASGEYAIDSKKIAQKLLQNDALLASSFAE